MSDERFDEFCGNYPICHEGCPLNGLPNGCRETFSEIDDFLKTEPKED